MSALGFRATRLFEPLFSQTTSSRVAQAPANGKVRQYSVGNIQQALGLIEAEGFSPVKEKPVSNCGRLRPILRNGAGKRIDRVLSVDKRVL
jgi:hypothetical protein